MKRLTNVIIVLCFIILLLTNATNEATQTLNVTLSIIAIVFYFIGLILERAELMKMEDSVANYKKLAKLHEDAADNLRERCAIHAAIEKQQIQRIDDLESGRYNHLEPEIKRGLRRLNDLIDKLESIEVEEMKEKENHQLDWGDAAAQQDKPAPEPTPLPPPQTNENAL